MLKLEMQNIFQLKLTKKLNFLWFMTLTEVSKKKLKLNKLEKNKLNYIICFLSIKRCKWIIKFVHLVFFTKKNISNQTKLKHYKIFYLKKIIKSYISISSKISIFIHSNIITKETKKLSKIKNVKFIKHNLINQNPRYFPWKCRDLMEKQRNKFDVFIYSEDDILFTKKNFSYWLKHKDICLLATLILVFWDTKFLMKKNIFNWCIQTFKGIYNIK